MNDRYWRLLEPQATKPVLEPWTTAMNDRQPTGAMNDRYWSYCRSHKWQSQYWSHGRQSRYWRLEPWTTKPILETGAMNDKADTGDWSHKQTTATGDSTGAINDRYRSCCRSHGSNNSCSSTIADSSSNSNNNNTSSTSHRSLLSLVAPVPLSVVTCGSSGWLSLVAPAVALVSVGCLWLQ